MSRGYEQQRGQNPSSPRSPRPAAPAQFGLAPYGNAARQADLGLTSEQPECLYDEAAPSLDPTPLQQAPSESAPATSVHFETDSTRLSRPTKEALHEMLAALRATCATDEQLFITVEGFADHRGAEAYNRGLARRRAEAVATFLERRLGLTVQATASLGEDDTCGLPQARRVDVWVERHEVEEYSVCSLCIDKPDADHPQLRSTLGYQTALQEAWAHTSVSALESVGDEVFKPAWEDWRAAFKWMSNADAQRLYDEYEGLPLYDVGRAAHRKRIPAGGSEMRSECAQCDTKECKE
ncbi:MAG: OmpA family protein [Myxococcales bacterium]|nr:OmpA family protein [Myxococcales bacterium]